MFRARHIHFSNKVYHFHIIWWYIQVVFLYHFTSLKYTFKFKTDWYTTSFKFSYPLKKRLYPIKTIIRISRCYIAFSNQPHFNRFHSSWIAFTSGLLSILCPAQPAIILAVYTIIYIIFFSCFSCQPDLDRLQPSCSVRLSVYLSIFWPGFPSIIFSISRIKDMLGLLSLYFDKPLILINRQLDKQTKQMVCGYALGHYL